MKMTDTEYHHKVDEVFHTIENAIEAMIDEQDADIDIDASGGVLDIAFEDGSKIVINKQEPLHEIWLATRFGGYHFSFDGNQWYDSRNKCEFVSHLESSITKQSGLVITF
ncbi:iron donor protein CyaY [Parashewanella curva]|uniref:Iron-sulfur cluster assembly protein CyaY n=1 Tax=Parashewanella curva TaxID=2338552 RepID=A0A3L8Q1U0_9GAMM|nr:iron donor protein CyaY [Parashewanella curva]RLV60282.1 iron donor protein CyaY [Parashewanella curva]